MNTARCVSETARGTAVGIDQAKAVFALLRQSLGRSRSFRLSLPNPPLRDRRYLTARISFPKKSSVETSTFFQAREMPTVHIGHVMLVGTQVFVTAIVGIL